MTALEELIEPLAHSPRLPEVISLLEEKMREELERRTVFYEEMTPEQKIEFIDGEVILHSPARNEHLGATSLISRLLSTHVDLHKLGNVKIEKCLCVFPRNDYEPDIVFFGLEKTASLKPDTMKFSVPDFVVEVLSKSTEIRDRGVKFEDFAAHGVKEYWIVDAEAEIIEQYILESEDFELWLKSDSGVIKSQVITGFEAEIEAFFNEEKNLASLREMMA